MPHVQYWVRERAGMDCPRAAAQWAVHPDRKSTRLNSSHSQISHAVFCLKKQASLIPATLTTPTAWSITEGENSTTAEASRELTNKITITCIVELPKQGHLFRLRIRLTNA